MSSIGQLLANESLSKLIQAQRYLDKAATLFDEVFREEGAPCDTECVLEAFYDALADCGKKIERLMGSAVYHGLFPVAETSSTHLQD